MGYEYEEQDMLLTKPERDVIHAMRNGGELERYRRSLLDIEVLLARYNVAITAPLSDAILEVLEERDEFRKALEPFADMADRIDNLPYGGPPSPLLAVMDECKAARKVLRGQ